MFKEYNYGVWKEEIRSLLRERLNIKEKIWRHKKKIGDHEEKIKILKNKTLVIIEKKLNKYLERAGNKID